MTEEEAAAALGMKLGEYRILLDEVRPVSFVPIDSDADSESEGADLHETIADENQPSRAMPWSAANCSPSSPTTSSACPTCSARFSPCIITKGCASPKSPQSSA